MSALRLHVIILFSILQHVTALRFEWGGAGDMNFTYDGDASAYGPHEVKLTMGVADAVFHASSGRMRYAHPLSLCPQASFTTSFTFRMSLGITNAPAYRGDGIAFFVSPANSGALPSPPLPTTKGLFGGLFGNNSIKAQKMMKRKSAIAFAVEFDSSQESWDPDDNHVGIDVGSLFSLDTASLNASGIVLNSGRDITVRIDYNGAQHGKLDVYASYSGGDAGSRPIRVLFTQSLWLCRLLRGGPAIIGFSSASRGSVETHDLLSWTWQSS